MKYILSYKVRPYNREELIMDYKEKVIEMIQKIESEKFMKFLYNMIVSFKEQWGY